MILLFKKGEDNMKYIIIYNNKQNHNYASSRSDLLHRLKILKDEHINDIRKIYKTGISDSVFDKYTRYINQ